MHTRIFGGLAAISALPSVSLLSALALNPDFPIAVHTGWLFTHSALVCSALVVVTLISAVADLMER